MPLFGETGTGVPKDFSGVKMAPVGTGKPIPDTQPSAPYGAGGFMPGISGEFGIAPMEPIKDDDPAEGTESQGTAAEGAGTGAVESSEAPVTFGDEGLGGAPAAEAEEEVSPATTEETPVSTSRGETFNPGFTLLDKNCEDFAAEFSPRMETPRYIGDSQLLLSYLYKLERRFQLTMPIKACGIDPVVFEHVEFVPLSADADSAEATTFCMDVDGTKVLYELAKVDNELYMSCVSECLNPDYMKAVIQDATVNMVERGEYVFPMVGYREMSLQEGESTAKLLRTLRLNTFEMSTLCAYMEGFDAVMSFEVLDGKQCIRFCTSK